MVLASWFIVFNEEDDEYYLWERKRAYRPKITLRDFEKVIPKGVNVLDLSPQQLNAYLPLIPIHKRVAQGVLWREVVSSRDSIIQNQIEAIEEIEKYGGALQVKAVAGWSAYPGVKHYRK